MSIPSLFRKENRVFDQPAFPYSLHCLLWSAASSSVVQLLLHTSYTIGLSCLAACSACRCRGFPGPHPLARPWIQGDLLIPKAGSCLRPPLIFLCAVYPAIIQKKQNTSIFNPNAQCRTRRKMKAANILRGCEKCVYRSARRQRRRLPLVICQHQQQQQQEERQEQRLQLLSGDAAEVVGPRRAPALAVTAAGKLSCRRPL